MVNNSSPVSKYSSATKVGAAIGVGLQAKELYKLAKNMPENAKAAIRVKSAVPLNVMTNQAKEEFVKNVLNAPKPRLLKGLKAKANVALQEVSRNLRTAADNFKLAPLAHVKETAIKAAKYAGIATVGAIILDAAFKLHDIKQATRIKQETEEL